MSAMAISSSANVFWHPEAFPGSHAQYSHMSDHHNLHREEGSQNSTSPGSVANEAHVLQQIGISHQTRRSCQRQTLFQLRDLASRRIHCASYWSRMSCSRSVIVLIVFLPKQRSLPSITIIVGIKEHLLDTCIQRRSK